LKGKRVLDYSYPKAHVARDEGHNSRVITTSTAAPNISTRVEHGPDASSISAASKLSRTQKKNAKLKAKKEAARKMREAGEPLLARE
jgi:hypothetical protein